VAEPSVVIGVIGRPHGVRGAVRATPTGATLATLALGEAVEAVEAAAADAPARRLVLAARAGTPQRPILSFEGVATRAEAAALTGAEIRVPAGRVAPLPDDDTFFVRDLVGCEVVLAGRVAGRVTAVHEAPANDVLEVAGDDGVLLVPFTGDAVTAVEPAERRITVRPGLFGGPA
jgi:16S rRNA processing protein RimM